MTGKKGGKATAAPGGSAVITLSDGTKVPVGRPRGMDNTQYEQMLEMMRKNPEFTKQTMKRASNMMRNPGFAQQFSGFQLGQSPFPKEAMEKLKDDPELKEIFEELEKGGVEAMSKYWDDRDVMSKISKRMQELNIRPAAQATEPAATGAPAPSVEIKTIHAAAKKGDVDKLKKLLEAGAGVDEKDDRGISALGVAVGFNKLAAIEALLEAGANVNATDPAGNTPLHYAAGYGRKEAAEKLLAAGADARPLNHANQTPLAVAELNKEKELVTFLQSKCEVGDDQYL